MDCVLKAILSFHHALADETRWRLVQLLFDEPLCVCELVDILGMPGSSVSSHLQVIRKAGLLDSEARGKWVYYRVKADFRQPLLGLREFFGVSAASEPVLRADAERAARRLAEREASCCPLPRELERLKPLAARPDHAAPR